MLRLVESSIRSIYQTLWISVPGGPFVIRGKWSNGMRVIGRDGPIDIEPENFAANARMRLRINLRPGVVGGHQQFLVGGYYQSAAIVIGIAGDILQERDRIVGCRLSICITDQLLRDGAATAIIVNQINPWRIRKMRMKRHSEEPLLVAIIIGDIGDRKNSSDLARLRVQ